MRTMREKKEEGKGGGRRERRREKKEEGEHRPAKLEQQEEWPSRKCLKSHAKIEIGREGGRGAWKGEGTRGRERDKKRVGRMED